jgi:carboxypeptidase Taq
VDLERLLINGQVNVYQLPDLWEQRMKQYLGVCPKDHATGVLQDVHWCQGLFGYFPTYVLGNTYAAQLDYKLRQDVPEVDACIRRGQFHPLLEWMRQHVHRYGCLYPPRELIRQTTGAEPSSQYLIDSLRRKYEKLYGLA